MALDRLPNTPGVQVRASCRELDEVNPHTRHHHEFFEILCVSEGHTHVLIRDQEVRAGPGDLLIYYPYEDHHEFVQPGRFSIVCLRFAPEKTRMAGGFPDKSEVGPVIHLPWPELFQNLFDQMIVEQQMSDPWSDVMMRVHLTHFVVLLQRALNCDSDETGERHSDTLLRIRKAVELIHHSLDTDLRLKDLADQAYMSESHFSHTFKEMVGVSPKQYVTRAKMLKAQELLETSDLSVKAIAANLGYDDPGYFAKVFARSVGENPSEFRENRRK